MTSFVIRLVSLLIGVSCGLVFALVLRGRRGPRRAQLGLLVGVPALILMAVWAFGWGDVPLTLGPFVVLCLLSMLEGRHQAGSDAPAG
jgi:ABC-type amino acid transport system permease subunit